MAGTRSTRQFPPRAGRVSRSVRQVSDRGRPKSAKARAPTPTRPRTAGSIHQRIGPRRRVGSGLLAQRLLHMAATSQKEAKLLDEEAAIVEGDLVLGEEALDLGVQAAQGAANRLMGLDAGGLTGGLALGVGAAAQLDGAADVHHFRARSSRFLQRDGLVGLRQGDHESTRHSARATREGMSMRSTVSVGRPRSCDGPAPIIRPGMPTSRNASASVEPARMSMPRR